MCSKQVFSKADVWFSVDGATYEEEPLSYSYIPDIVLENARNVSIGLHEREGRFLKIHLYFAARWIMISEVVFDGSEYPLLNRMEYSPKGGAIDLSSFLLFLFFSFFFFLNNQRAFVQRLQGESRLVNYFARVCVSITENRITFAFANARQLLKQLCL